MKSTAYKNDLTQVNDLVTKLQLPIHFFDSQEPGFVGQRIFVVTLKVGTLCAVGKGHNKKEARARAASIVLGPLKQMYLPPLQSNHQATAKKRNTQEQVQDVKEDIKPCGHLSEVVQAHGIKYPEYTLLEATRVKEEEERSQIDFLIEASPESQSPQHHPWLDMIPTKPEVDKDERDALVSSPVEDRQDICTSPDVEEEWEEYLDSDTASVHEAMNNETGSGLCENQETRPEAEIYEDTVVSEISSQPEELQEEHVIEADLEPESQFHSLVDTTSTKHEVDKDERETGAEVLSASPETSLIESRETDETKPEVDKEEEERSQTDFIIDASPESQSPQHHPWLDMIPTKPEVDKDKRETGAEVASASPETSLKESRETDETKPEVDKEEKALSHLTSEMNTHGIESVPTERNEIQEELLIEAFPEPACPQKHHWRDISSPKPEVDKEEEEVSHLNLEISSDMNIHETESVQTEVDEIQEELIIEVSPEPEFPPNQPLLDISSLKPEADKDKRETGAEFVSASPETSLMDSREKDETKPEVDKEEVCPLSEDVTASASVDITEAGDVLTDQRRSLEMIEADVVSQEDFPCLPPILEGPSVASVLVRALVQKLVQKSYFKPEDQGENIRLLLEKTEEHIHHQDVPISLKNMRAIGKAATKGLLRECRLQGAPLRAEDEIFQKAMVKHLNHCLNKFLFGPQRRGLSRLFAAVGRFFCGS
uniref:DRBM domain-containing protein n=1 Tax=Knipowitschia caucasica TaxID=637954 RepID=A0AAV2KLK5_KNICA